MWWCFCVALELVFSLLGERPFLSGYRAVTSPKCCQETLWPEVSFNESAVPAKELMWFSNMFFFYRIIGFLEYLLFWRCMRFCAGQWWAIEASAITSFSWERYFLYSLFPFSQIFSSWLLVFLNLRAKYFLISYKIIVEWSICSKSHCSHQSFMGLESIKCILVYTV